MRSLLDTRFLIAAHLIVIILVIVVAAWSVHTSTDDLRSALMADIQNQESTLEHIAELTDRNGADEVVAEIVSDCPQRGKFESLLGDLSSLGHQQLLQTQQLFESCGSFYAERKAIMVSRLKREAEIFEANVALLDTLDDEHDYSAAPGSWNMLVGLEEERSALLSRQVDIQRDIVGHLIRGENIHSEDVRDLAAEAQNVGQQLSVLDNRIDKLRTELIG